MRINLDQKSLDMEQRDINYVLPAYIRNYLFYSKNEDPVEIVFPMFSSAPHPIKPGVTIPIRYVPEISPEAVEIVVDGANVPEATEAEIAVKDEQDEMREKAKEGLGLEPKPEPEPEMVIVCKGGCGRTTEGMTMETRIGEFEQVDESMVPEWTCPDCLVKPSTKPEEEVSPARAAFAEVATEEPKAEPEPTTREIKGPPSGPILPPGTPLDNMAPRDRTDQMRVAKDLRPEPEVDEGKEVEVVIEKPEEQAGDTSGQ